MDRRTLPLLAVLLLAGAASPARASSAEEFRVIRYGELKAGFERITRSKEAKKGASLHRTDVERTLSYFEGTQIEVTSQETFLEADDGALVEFSYSGVSAQGKTSIHGEVRGDKVHYLIVHPGQNPQEMDLPWNGKTVGPKKLEETIRAKGLAPGTRYSVTTYSFAISAPVELRFEAAGKGKAQVLGRERTLNRLVVTGSDLTAGNRETPRSRWLDDGGAFVMESDPAFGERTVTACTKEIATAPSRGAVTRVPVHASCLVGGEGIRPRAMDAALFLLAGPASLLKLSFDGPGQSAGRDDRGGVRVGVRAAESPSVPARRPVSKAEMEPYLKENYFLDFEQGDVRKTAERVAGSVKDAAKAAEALRRFVFETLRKKPVNYGMATASTALQCGEGDALEHAVVLAALCRALGVPARVAGGLLVTGPSAKVHAWTEAWVGAWIPLDATQESPCDASRIRFADSDLNNGCPDGPVAECAALANDVAVRLKVELLNYQLKGFILEPDKIPKEVQQIRGDQYVHALYGFGFAKPSGFRFNDNLRGMPNAVIAAAGGGERVMFRIAALPDDQTIAGIVEGQKANFDLSEMREIQVGGRPGLVVKFRARGGRGGYNPLVCYVRDGDTLFTIEFSDNDPSARGAFELALKTLAFKN